VAVVSAESALGSADPPGPAAVPPWAAIAGDCGAARIGSAAAGCRSVTAVTVGD
jgi:hypothetical protein